MNASFSNSLLRLVLALLSMAAMLCMPFQADAEESVRKAEWAEPVDKTYNLYRVTPGLYRSARLDKVDIDMLKSLGIKSVVSLRAFHSDEKHLRGSGIRLIRNKLYTWDIDDRHVVTALRAIRTAEKEGPVLLHCLHGADRTGMITAMYRMLYQGWTREQAMEEMTEGGYGYHSIWKNIPRYLQTVDVEKIRILVDRN